MPFSGFILEMKAGNTYIRLSRLGAGTEIMLRGFGDGREMDAR